MNPLSLKDQAKIALLGGAYRWQDTRVEETSMARASDPFRHAGLLPDGWWEKAEPRDPVTGEKLIRLMNGRTLRITDGTAEENKTLFHPKDKDKNDEEIAAHHRQRESGRDELEPNETESIMEWLARCATRGGTETPFWKMMHSYASRFRGDLPAKKTLDRKLISSFLKNLRGTARGATR